MDRSKGYSDLLTVSKEIDDGDLFYLTGNEYISIPDISVSGGLGSLNIIRLDCRGLLEFRGSDNKPLIAPMIMRKGINLLLEENLSWEYRHDWIPTFSCTSSEGLGVKGEIITPPGNKGLTYSLEIKNNSASNINLEAGWYGQWESFNYFIFESRPLEGRRSIAYNSWTKSLVLEAAPGIPLAALALATEPAGSWELNTAEGTFENRTTLTLAPGESYCSHLFGAINLEKDGAGTTNIDLRRQGSEKLKAYTAGWLESRRIEEKDQGLSGVLNRNLLFSYFFSCGRCLESEALVPVTSRSPRYYVSGAFWSRDLLLWHFPALLMVDRERARELLSTIFSRHINNAGDHAHYLNGTMLYPGFELDQLCAFFIALKNYLQESGDYTLLNEKVIQSGLNLLAEKALEQFDPEAGLYKTFLDPSDDPVVYPFVTYDNALLKVSFDFLGKLQADNYWNHKSDFTILAGELMHSIYEHCIVKGPLGTMFAWSVDGKGKFFLYDNPPGSLQLLAHYGFCPADDTVYKNTARWIRSSNNRYFHLGRKFEEAGSIHAGNPWPLAACNDLLSCNMGASDFFRDAEMDNGFCCETVDPDSGKMRTGPAFASAAGFLAYALKNRRPETNQCPE